MNIKTTIVYEHLMESDNQDKRIVVAQGGSRSGKTYNILIWWIVKLLQEEGKTLSIVRKTLPALKNSVLKDLVEVLEMMGLYDPRKYHKQEGFYELGSNIINWFSVDEPQKLRGSKRNYLFCNESNELSMEDWNQLIFRTDGKVVLDLNPSEINSWVYDLEKRDDCYYFVSTYKDNPFVSETIKQELLSLKDKDENLYRIYTEGLRGVPTKLVFTKFTPIDTIPTYYKLIGRGMDFGYNDPTTLVEVYQNNDELYIRELLFVRGTTFTDVLYKMEQMGIEKTDTIWCDSASPQYIEELKRHKFNTKPVVKKSILHGIDLMKRHFLFIEKSSVNVINEFQSYQWKTDRDGVLLDMPEDKYNHTIDAIRYVVESVIGNKPKKFTII
jgi:phage terminase large subunit